MNKDEKALNELRVAGNRILIDKFKEEVTAVAQQAYGLEVNDLIGDDLDIFHALSDKETPTEFVQRIGEKMDLDLMDGFQFKMKYKVQAEVVTYCYIEIEAHSVEEANQIAEDTDGGDFITEDNDGDFRILHSLTQRV